MQGEHARVEFTVALTGGSGRLLPESGQVYAVRSGWRIEDGDWNLIRRTDHKVHKTLKARDLWEKIGYAAWACADPGIQFHTTVNDWHTCPAGGAIRASSTDSSSRVSSVSARRNRASGRAIMASSRFASSLSAGDAAR